MLASPLFSSYPPNIVLITFLLFLAGIVVLYFGAEWLVRGSSQLALILGVSPVVVGLTVVAMGTSAPELVASLQAQLTQNAGNIVIGNVIGSNIYNVGLILGLAAIMAPLQIHSDIVVREAPLAIGASVLLLLLMFGGVVTRVDGVILFACFIAYIFLQLWIVRSGKKKDQLVKELTEELTPPSAKERKQAWWFVVLVLVGIVGLVIGARLLIDNAIIIAKSLGISQRVIGLTLVAFGTSLPELATTLVAAIKKERDIAVANVIGSNIFNILLIVGTVAMVRPISFEQTLLTRDGIFMLGVIMLMMLFVIRKRRLERWMGALLVLACLVYGYFLF